MSKRVRRGDSSADVSMGDFRVVVEADGVRRSEVDGGVLSFTVEGEEAVE